MKNRYWRFFREDGRALILAFDHGGGGDIWVDPGKVIPAAVEGGIDGILSTYGVLKAYRKGIGKVGTMLRMEVFGSSLAKSNTMDGPIGTPFTVEDAVRLGVDGVMAMGIIATEQDANTMRYIAKLAADADKWGLITAAEMLPNGFNPRPEDRSVRSMNIACRVAAEIGVDFVKTQYVAPKEEFSKVVGNCYVPILVLGGAKADDDRQVLKNAKEAMEAGCKGLVIGRNVWGHKNVIGMATALNKIVHGNANVDEAMKYLA